MQFPAERRGRAWRIALVAAIAAGVLVAAWKGGLFGLHDAAALTAAIARARSVPHLAPLFVVTYAVAAAFGVPATPFTLAGGALFGISRGVALNWIGELSAAMIGFGMTRSMGIRRGRPVAADGTTAELASGHGRSTLFRLRLVPVAPFALLNAGAAIGGMAWWDFIVATAVGIIPITVVYTVSASKLVAGVEGSGREALLTAAVAGGALILVSFLPTAFGRRSRRPQP